MVWERLRDLRKQKRVTALNMAGVIGLKTGPGYCKKELGYTDLSLIEAKQLADYFGMSIDELFFAEERSQ